MTGYKAPLIATAIFASASMAQAATVTVANGVASSVGSLSQPVYQDNGFEWTNPGGYGSDCTRDYGDPRAVTMFALDNLYHNEGCGNDVGFSRTDGSRFDVTSVEVIGQDFTQLTPDSASPFDGQSFVPYQVDEFNLAQELADAGIDDLSDRTKVDAFVAEQQAKRTQDIADYFDWLYSSTGAPARDQFYVVGKRDGSEVIRQYFSDTNGPATITLNGFSDLDEVVFGHEIGPYLWDHYYLDYGAHEIASSGQMWCPRACEELAVYGFDYAISPSVVVDAGGPGAPVAKDPAMQAPTTNSADATSTAKTTGTSTSADITPVPIPGGAGMLIVALGLLGLGARRKA